MSTQYLLWGIGASATLVLTGLLVALRVLYRVMRTVEEIVIQVRGDKEEGVSSLREFRAFVEDELSYNGGQSLKDKVRKISRQVGAE